MEACEGLGRFVGDDLAAEALGKALAAARGVAKDDGIRFGIKTQLVRPGDESGAHARDGDVALREIRLDLPLQLERGSRRRVLLLLVVRFGDVGRIHGKARHGFRRHAREAVEEVHANRKVGSINHADAACLDDLADLVQVLVPAGGAHHQVAADSRHPPDVPERGLGRGEIQADVDGGKFLTRDARPAGIGVNIHHQTHLESPLRGKLRQDLAHLAVAEQSQPKLPRRRIFRSWFRLGHENGSLSGLRIPNYKLLNACPPLHAARAPVITDNQAATPVKPNRMLRLRPEVIR